MSQQLCERCYNAYTEHEYCNRCTRELDQIHDCQIPHSPPRLQKEINDE